jgi:hypothetical protein
MTECNGVGPSELLKREKLFDSKKIDADYFILYKVLLTEDLLPSFY